MKFIDVKVEDKINKPIGEVFDAVTAVYKMTGYFISRSSGPMRQDETITWYFDDYNVDVLVKVLKVTKNDHISFEWSAGGTSTTVDLAFSSPDDAFTLVSITERSFQMDERGMKTALGQTQGWTDFLCNLKAFLYTSINLRTGKYRNS